MDLNFTDEQKAFRAEVRGFLEEKLPQRLSDKVRFGQRLEKADYEEWHAILNEKGWLAGNWPMEHGGAGWNAVERHIFEEETTSAAQRRVDRRRHQSGPLLIGTVGQEGSDDQRVEPEGVGAERSAHSGGARSHDQKIDGLIPSHALPSLVIGRSRLRP